MIFRPATPGFLVTLTATILLMVVSFSVPTFKSVYFLRARMDLNGQQGIATFGVLGYCLNVGGNVNCTSPRVGYEFNPNALLGNTTPIQIPQVVVKWLTYALVLHIVALVFAAGSAVFGLLAHVRECSMACFSTCISGFAATITLIVFIFDVAFFFLFKARINNVPGGSAQTGNAIWLTLTAMLLLFFAGCFYTFGRCCIGNRPRGPRDKFNPPTHGDTNATNSEAVRLDAVKAEADRKARQKQSEIGLPAFQEYDPTRPLTSKYDEEDGHDVDHVARQASRYSNKQPHEVGQYVPRTGYAPAAPGTSAMEAYYDAPSQPQTMTGYPPQPPMHDQYPSTQYNAYDAANAQPTHGQYPSSIYGHGQYASHEAAHGHSAQDTSYYATASASQYPQPLHAPNPSYVPSVASAGYPSSHTPIPGTQSAYTPPSSFLSPPLRTAREDYTHDLLAAPNSPSSNTARQGIPPTNFLGATSTLNTGRDYAFSTTPVPVSPSSPTTRQSPGPRGPRSPTSPSMYNPHLHSDNPPDYEAGHTTAAWPT